MSMGLWVLHLGLVIWGLGRCLSPSSLVIPWAEPGSPVTLVMASVALGTMGL